MSSMAETLQPFICGGLSACFASFVIHPIDLVKVRMQLLDPTKATIPGPLTMASSIMRNDGFTALYSGLSASLTRQATYGTARIGLHRVFTKELEKLNAGASIPFWQKAASSMASGGVAVCIGTPFDVALVRMQNDGSLSVVERRNYTGVTNALARIYKDEGLSKLWRGLTPNILRGMSMNLGMMACYDQAKQIISDMTKSPDSLMTQLSASAVAGFCCALMSLPFDMLKSRLQNMKLNPHTGLPPYTGVLDCASKILKNEGPLAFFRGFSAYYGRCAPHAMIILISIEQVTAWYRSVLLPQKEGIRDHESLMLSSQVTGTYADAESFFVLQRKNRELEEEITRLRKELEGKIFTVGSRVIATSNSHWNHYQQGCTGVIVKVDSFNDPYVKWDHSKETMQTSRLRISAYEELKLSDGLVLDYRAVGTRVVALTDSGHGHYKKGGQGVIVRLNPTDPVVRWDLIGRETIYRELQTSRHKLAAAKPEELKETGKK